MSATTDAHWRIISRLVHGGFLSIFLQGCWQSAPEVVEVNRITSPDEKIDLVIEKLAVYATVSTPFQASLVQSGAHPGKNDLILKIDKSSNLEGQWLNRNTVSLRCTNARIWHFQNFWGTALKEGAWVNVAVVLECGEHGYSAGHDP